MNILPLHHPQTIAHRGLLSETRYNEASTATLMDGDLEQLKALIKEKVVVFGTDEKIVTYSGDDGEWIFDFRRVLLKPENLDALAEIFWKLHKDDKPFQVGGSESAAIPLITAIVMKGLSHGRSVNGFYLRKSRKKTGLTRIIEGELTNEPVVLVDDLINSGGTFMRQIEVLKEEGATIKEIFTVVRFREREQYAFAKESNVQITSLFTAPDFGFDFLEKKEPPVRHGFHKHWKFQSEEANHFYVVPKSAPALDETNLYFGSDNGNFWALKQDDGKVVWNYKVGFHAKGKYIFSSPKVYGGTVYFGSYDGNVYALDTTTGKPTWMFMEADWVGSSPELAPDLGMLFIGLEFGLFRKQGGIAALDIKTGKKIWEHTTALHTHSSPAYSKKYGAVWVGSNDGKAYLYDAKTGKERWVFQTGNDIKESAAFDESRDIVCFGSLDGFLYALKVSTGEFLFRFETKAGINSDPYVHDGKVFVASLDKNLYCIDLTSGELVWKFQTAGRIFSSPIVVGSSVYIGSNDGRFYEVNVETGTEMRRFQATERITNAAAYNEKTDRFYVPTCANEIYCLSKDVDELR